MAGFLDWIEGKIAPTHNHALPNGVLYLKGGDLTEELAEVNAPHSLHHLRTWFAAPFFETKQVVHVDLS